MRYFSILFLSLFILLLSISSALSYEIKPLDSATQKTDKQIIPINTKKNAPAVPKRTINRVNPIIQTKPIMNPANLRINTIKVLQPVKNASYQEGDQMSISFTSNMKKPFKVELVKFNSKTKIMDCNTTSIHRQGNTETFSTLWKVPQGNYNSLIKYAIRISNGSIEAFSEPFKIKNILKTTVYQIPATTVSNKYIARQHNAKLNRETPDPGGNRLRVGYTHFSKDDHHVTYVYRSWVHFDLSSLQGKGIVTKATLKFSHYAGCNTFTPFVNILNKQWNGSAKDLFYIYYKDLTSINPSSMPTTRVFDWITKPENNYGVVFSGPNEVTLVEDNDVCVSMYDNVILEVELTGQ